jgi:hypothetical protein
MSDGGYLPAAKARAEDNLRGDLDAIQARADADEKLQRALLIESWPDEAPPSSIADRERFADKPNGFFRPLDGAETARFADFAPEGDRLIARDTSEFFAVVTPGPGGTLQRSFWRAPQRIVDVLIELGEAEPGTHRRLSKLFPCCTRLKGQRVANEP